MSQPAFAFAGFEIEACGSATIELPIATLTDHSPVNLPVHIFHGRKAGPVLLVSAAVHGDEIIGVEIIRRLLNQDALKRLRGTLMAVPIVNAFGFLARSRYLPDRRDLNRSFPGQETGSLAAQLAAIFLGHVVSRADLLIDLHSAAVHRSNLPQIRISPDQAEAENLARVFGAPVYLKARVLEGSLRESAARIGVNCLLYEAGEALRYDETAVRVGLRGIMRVMRELHMLPTRSAGAISSLRASGSRWIRAGQGGLLRAYKANGDTVCAGEVLGVISDPIGSLEEPILADTDGLIIGRTHLPLVHQGDALFHVAQVHQSASLERRLDAWEATLQDDPLFDDDDEII